MLSVNVEISNKLTFKPDNWDHVFMNIIYLSIYIYKQSVVTCLSYFYHNSVPSKQIIMST